MEQFLCNQIEKGSAQPLEFRYYLASYWPLFVVAAVCSTPIVKKIWTGILGKLRGGLAADILETAVLAILFIVSVAFLVSGSYNPFLYFRF